MRLLPLKDGIRSTIYTIVINALRSDPLLGKIIHPRGWRTYTDEPDNEVPQGEDTLPAIEVLPYAIPAQPASLITQQSEFGMTINIATEGIDIRDILNLWELVEGALFKPADPSLYQSVNQALQALPRKGQVADLRLSSPAVTVVQAQLARQVLVAGGIVIMNLRVPR